MKTASPNHILSLLQTGFITIGVTFEADLRRSDAIDRARNRNRQEVEYDYKALESDQIKLGDLVVVDSPNTGLTIVEVTRVDKKPRINLDAPFPYKWIVQKIDRTRYDEVLQQEEDFKEALVEVERAKKREEVVKDFQERLPEGSEARKLFEQAVQSVQQALPNAE